MPGADRWYRADALGQLAEVVEPNAYASPPGSVFGPGNVIDILKGSAQPGALLDAFPQKTTGTGNQLWRLIPDPAGSGYSFIQSKLNGNVIDILKGSAQPGAPLDASPQKTTGTGNQLWRLIPDPAGSGYSFIQSKLNGNVIDILKGSAQPGAPLDASPQKTTGADNQLWRLIPDPAGSGYSFIQSKLNGNVKTSYSYNGLGLLQAVQGSQGQERRFRYDSLGRLTAQFLPEKSATLDGTGAYVGSGGLWSDAFTYDNRSNLTSHTDPRGVKTVYDYAADPLDPIDPLNRLYRVSYEFTGPADPSIQPTAPADYSYMTTGDVTRIYQITSSPIGSDQAVYEYGYDTEGRLASTQLSWPTAGPSPLVLQLGYEYDALNRLTGKTYPAQSEAAGRGNVAYSYDLSGNIAGLQVDGTDYASQFTYNPANQATSVTVGPTGSQQTVETFAYDPATNLLASQQVKQGNTVLLDLAYSYLPNGRLYELIEGGGQRQFTYLYDALDRLWKMTKAAGADGPEWGEEYTFDEFGNRIAVKASGKLNGAPAPPDGLPALTYDPATNHITTAGFSYDPAGNRTRSQRADGSWLRYKYDQAGRLCEVTDDNGRALESYGYNSASKRLVTRHGTENTYYFWDGGQVITEHTQLLPTVNPAWSRSLVFLGSRLLATFQPGQPGDLVDFHHPDRLGTRLITNRTNNNAIEQATLPFGTLIPGEPKNPVNPVFTTYDRSVITGVDYAVNRYYDLGRFTQVDPVGMSLADLANPQSLNLYSYTRNDPMNLLDPSGLDPAAVCFQDITITGDGTTYGPTQCAAFNTPSDATYNALYNADPTADFFFGRTIGGSAGPQGIVARGAGAWNIGSFVSSYLGYSGPTIPKTTARATTLYDWIAIGGVAKGALEVAGFVALAAGAFGLFFGLSRQALNNVAGQIGESIISDLPGYHSTAFESILEPGTEVIPDLAEELGIAEVKNVAYQALTKQITDYILIAQSLGLPFYLITRLDTVLSAPLMEQIELGNIEWIASLL